MTTPLPGAALDAALSSLAANDTQLAGAISDLSTAVTALQGEVAELKKRPTSPTAPTAPTPVAREIGKTEPTKDNTGLSGSSGGSRSTRTGDLICQAGQTYTDIDVVNGHVILAPGCTVRRVTATGRKSGGTYYSAIFWGTDAKDALVEDCVARPSKDTARVSLNGFGWSGIGYTARWNDISGVTDYFHGGGPNDGSMKIHANYCHDYAFYAVDPDQAGGWNHADFVQIMKGNAEIIGNSSSMNYDPVLSVGVEQLLANQWYAKAWGGGYGNHITVTLTTSNSRGWKVQSNWFRGGEVAFQLPKKGKGFDTGNDGDLSGNRVFALTANAWHGGTSRHHFRQDSGTGLVTNLGAANVYADTAKIGTPLPGTYNPLSIKSPTSVV